MARLAVHEAVGEMDSSEDYFGTLRIAYSSKSGEEEISGALPSWLRRS